MVQDTLIDKIVNMVKRDNFVSMFTPLIDYTFVKIQNYIYIGLLLLCIIFLLLMHVSSSSNISNIGVIPLSVISNQ
jgi:hypothetical protein